MEKHTKAAEIYIVLADQMLILVAVNHEDWESKLKMNKIIMNKNNSQLSILSSQFQEGFIALTSLLVISAVTLIIAVSISLLGVGESKASLDFKKGQETLKIAESCIEESLLRLRDNASYTGGSLNVGDGSCTISISGTGNDRTIDVTATISGPPQYTRKLQVTAKRAGNSINIINWTEVE